MPLYYSHPHFVKDDLLLREYYFLFALACQAPYLFQALGGALTL